MEVAHPAFLPDPALDRAEMEAMQREIARAAVFADDLPFGPEAVRWAPGGQTTLDDSDERDADPRPGGAGAGTGSGSETGIDAEREAPVVVGVDQAFRDEEALSAVVAFRDGDPVERAVGRAPLELPYIPGLLSFREAPAIVDALASLSVAPDLLVVDGSGRIHFRQAGIATHVGVLFDCPAVGVAKNLLCGTPRESLADPLPAGARVAVEADADVERVETAGDEPEEAGAQTVIGYAFQSRQYPDPARRHVNPLYVSPGHRASEETTVDLIERLCAGYKLPEPTRRADQYADEATGA
jgi:deoxyribonuclease V